MKPVRWRRALLAPIIAIALTGCSMHEASQSWYNPTDGTSTDAGSIAIRNVVVVATDDGQATVLANFVNRGADDQLVEVIVGDASGTPTPATVEIPSGASTRIGPDAAARVDVSGSDASPGRSVDVEFRFENAPRVTLDALAQENDGLYAGSIVVPL